MRVAWLGVVLSVSGCAAPALAARPRVWLQVRSVRDEDTGVETSEWRVEARAPESGRAWLTGAGGAPVELARAPGLFRAERREAGRTAWLDGGRLLLVVAGVVEDGAAVADAVLARDQGDLDGSDLVSTAVDLPPPPPRPALEGLRQGPDGPEVRWSADAPAWFDLVVSDAVTGGTVFRSLGAGRPSSDGATTLDEPLPPGLLQPDRSYVVELRARAELGLVAVERATRRTLRLP